MKRKKSPTGDRLLKQIGVLLIAAVAIDNTIHSRYLDQINPKRETTVPFQTLKESVLSLQPHFLENNRVNDHLPSSFDNRTKLVLHVGPSRTGTTSLQCHFGYLSTQNILEKDNFVFLGKAEGCRTYNSSISAANIFGKEAVDDALKYRGNYEVQQEFADLLDNLHLQGSNAMLFDENLSLLTNRHLRAIRKRFQSEWNIQVVVAYRHLYELLPSLYNKKYAPDNNPEWAQHWPSKTTKRKIKGKTIGMAFEPFSIDSGRSHPEVKAFYERTKVHPTAELYEVFEPIFGRVNTVDIHHLPTRGTKADPYVTHILCDVIEETKKSCQEALEGNIAVRKEFTSVRPNMVYDVLATEAHKEGLIHLLKSKSSYPTRQVVAKAIKGRHEGYLNKTINDLPMRCPRKETWERYLKLSIELEMAIFGDISTNETFWESRKAEHRRLFLSKVKRTLCHVDARKALIDKGWRRFLAKL